MAALRAGMAMMADARHSDVSGRLSASAPAGATRGGTTHRATSQCAEADPAHLGIAAAIGSSGLCCGIRFGRWGFISPVGSISGICAGAAAMCATGPSPRSSHYPRWWPTRAVTSHGGSLGIARPAGGRGAEPRPGAARHAAGTSRLGHSGSVPRAGRGPAFEPPPHRRDGVQRQMLLSGGRVPLQRPHPRSRLDLARRFAPPPGRSRLGHPRRHHPRCVPQRSWSRPLQGVRVASVGPL